MQDFFAEHDRLVAELSYASPEDAARIDARLVEIAAEVARRHSEVESYMTP